MSTLETMPTILPAANDDRAACSCSSCGARLPAAQRGLLCPHCAAWRVTYFALRAAHRALRAAGR